MPDLRMGPQTATQRAAIPALGASAKIALVGDSITHGYGDGVDVAHFTYDGFRPTLDGDLIAAGYGSLVYQGPITSGDYVPTQHHNGHDSYTCALHLAEVATYYGPGLIEPDIFGIQLGTNDSTASFAANYVPLIRAYHVAVPTARFVGWLPPQREGSAGVPVNSAALPGFWNILEGEGIIIYRGQPGADVLVVATSDYFDSPSTHPSITGYPKVGHSISPAFIRALQGAPMPESSAVVNIRGMTEMEMRVALADRRRQLREGRVELYPAPPPRPPATHFAVRFHGDVTPHPNDPHVDCPPEWPEETNPLYDGAQPPTGYVLMTAAELAAHTEKHQAAYDAFATKMRLDKRKEERLEEVSQRTLLLIARTGGFVPLEAGEKVKDRIRAAQTVEELEAVIDDR